MRVSTYNPADVALSFGGYLVLGFEPGTFIVIARNAENFVYTVGPDGEEGIRTKTNNRSALLTLTLRQSSPANLVLSNLANKDEISADGVVPFGLTDVNSVSTNYSSGKAWIQKPADATLADTPQGRAWVILLAEVPMIHGGAPEVAALAATLA